MLRIYFKNNKYVNYGIHISLWVNPLPISVDRGFTTLTFLIVV